MRELKRQKRTIRRRAWFLSFFLFPFSFFLPASAQDKAGPAHSAFSYKFENVRFYIPLIEIDSNADGSGELRFKRGESEEVITLKLKLLPSTVTRISQLFDSARFLDSTDDYQSKKDFSHLGWVTLAARQGERQRKARFNHTTNTEIKELADIFSALATQQIHLFDIETVGQYQPLDLPRQLDALETSLRLKRVAEPEQMLAALREIAASDTLPLIARNHAARIIKSIEKKQFKSPLMK